MEEMRNNKNVVKRIALILAILTFLISFSFKNFAYSQTKILSSDDSLRSLNFLRRQIYDVLKNFNDSKSNYGIAVYSLDKKEYYFKHNIDSYFIPASLTKLFTTFAALNKLGKDYRIKTFIYADGEITDGILNGNLYLYGTGDPLFSSSDLDAIAEDIKKLGIRRIKGNIYSDPSFFDNQTDRFAYSGDFDVVQPTQPITSIAIERNIVTVVVTAGDIYGRSVNVQVIPSSYGIKIYNSAKVSRNLKSFNESTIHLNYGGGELLAQSQQSKTRKITPRTGFRVTSETDPNGYQTILISGGLPSGTSKTYTFFIENPPLMAAGALRKRVESNGIIVDGGIGISNVPFSKARVVSIISRNLIEVLKEMNKNSDNYLAETVFKLIGAVDKRMTSNSKEAIHYIFSLLDSLKIPCAECKMNDGSGLSRRNRFSPESIIHLLVNSMSNINTSFLDTLLSVAGFDGTLKMRMIGTSAQGKVFAKTGTHSNASGLAGFVKTLDNERLAFAFMYNGEKAFHFKKVEDELCRILAEFFYANTQE
jgi:D-alanyl-D-alanine carboxypeptidase